MNKENNGFIFLHRKILDNPWLDLDNDAYVLWTKILLYCTHQGKDVIFKGKRITLKPGQLLTGRKWLAEQANISESKTQRILMRLESEQQIEQQTTRQNRLITVINWKTYQKREQQNEQQMNNKRTTSEQQVNTYNNEIMKECNNLLLENDFNTFYSQYPRKAGKVKAKAIFLRLAKDELPAIMSALEKQKKSEQWQNPKYIPHPTTWLNQKRWQDEEQEMTPAQYAEFLHKKYDDQAIFHFLKKYDEKEALKHKVFQ